MTKLNSYDFKTLKKLTIAIPTYNRASYLDLCLQRIGDEILGLPSSDRVLVEVYVSNNASTDNTCEVLQKHKSLNLYNLEVNINANNIGVDLNIAKCYDSAETPYVWILGDDDIILDGALKLVLSALANGEMDILYLNNMWFTNNFNETVSKYSQKIKIYKDAFDFVKKTNVMLTFISAIIIRTQIGSAYRASLVGSNLIQLSWVLPMIGEGKIFGYSEDVLIAAKGSNSGNYKLAEVFGKNLVNITNTLLVCDPRIALEIQNGTIINFFPDFIIQIRKGVGSFSGQSIKKILSYAYKNNWRYYFFIAPLFILPISIANIFIRLARHAYNFYMNRNI